MSIMSADKMLKEYAEKVERYIDRVFDAAVDVPQILKEAMYYSISAGGKRIRPALCLEFYRILSGDPDDVLNFAAAIEMIHTYSLIHDDLPCMDNDDMRRGKPSCHKAFGEDIALLAGDALLTLAFETAADVSGNVDPAAAVKAVGALARAAGMSRMVGGQVLDLQSEGRRITLDELEKLQCGKTVAMLRVPAEIACIAAGAGERECRAAFCYCENIGRAFQIRDDILDVTADAAVLGKPTGSDALNEKNTYVSLLGLKESERLCEELTDQAIGALGIFGDSADLEQLARMLCGREK